MVCVSATLSTVLPGTLLLLRLYTKLRVIRKVDLTGCSLSTSQICHKNINIDIDVATLSFVGHPERTITHLLI